MVDRKKTNGLKALPGGKRSLDRPSRRRRLEGHNLLTPHIWPPYRAGHGATARDRSIANKYSALLNAALKERLGTPLRSVLGDESSSEDNVHCDFCQQKKSAILVRGPRDAYVSTALRQVSN